MASTNTSAPTGDLWEGIRQHKRAHAITFSRGSGTHSEETGGNKDLRI